MLYKVNRRIVINFKAYNPGSEVDLNDWQASHIRSGFITPLEPKAEPKPVEPEPKADEPAAEPKPVEPEPKADEPKAEPAGTGTEEKAAPVE